jgi:hypothetical protein
VAEFSLSTEPNRPMDFEQLDEGQKIVFQHKIGGAGDAAKNEKVGYIEEIDVQERDFPVKIKIGAEAVTVNGKDAARTYVEPSEINNVISE